MKRLITFLISISSLLTIQAKNIIGPELALTIHYSKPNELCLLDFIVNDNEILEIFDIVVQKSNHTYVEVRELSTNRLIGTFIGMPSKEFILDIYENELKPKIDRKISKLNDNSF